MRQLHRVGTSLSRCLHGATVLIVNDEGASAFETSCVLQWAGARILGPVSHRHAALRMIAKEAPDCALVNLELRGQISLNVPRALLDLSVPFVLVTNQYQRPICNEFRTIAVLRRPVDSFEAAAAVINALYPQCNSRRPELMISRHLR